jgi:ceramide kinase
VGNQGYEAELRILKEPPNRNDCDIKCFENCNVCAKPDESSSEDQEEYKRVTGKFTMINCANISCACDRSPSGFSPTCHLGDGYIHLILVRHGSIWQNVRLLLRLGAGKKEIAEYPFVEVHRTKKIYFKAITGTSMNSITDSTQPLSLGPNKYCSVWNCDGEVVQDAELMIR